PLAPVRYDYDRLFLSRGRCVSQMGLARWTWVRFRGEEQELERVKRCVNASLCCWEYFWVARCPRLRNEPLHRSFGPKSASRQIRRCTGRHLFLCRPLP